MEGLQLLGNSKRFGDAKQQDSPECLHNALFLHSQGESAPFLFIPMNIAVAFITAIIRRLTPRDDTHRATTATINDIETTAIPADREEGSASNSDEPPPYQPRSAEEIRRARWSAKTSKLSPAQLFVLVSHLFFVLLVLVFLLALMIQSLTFCMEIVSPIPIPVRIILWLLYTLNCFWASRGAMCWIMLLRNLWGPTAKKRFPMTETSLAWLTVKPVVMLGKGAAKAIELCQRRFCADALGEESEAEVELSLEIGQSELSDGDEASGEGEERVGLMHGMK
jgi:hypothetical protein